MNESHRSSSIISKKKEKNKVTVTVKDTIIMGALLMSIVWLVLPSTVSIPIIPTNTIIPAAFATTLNGGGGITCEGEAATIVGTNGNNDITGTSGDDVIAALGGNDRIRALGGNDIVCGGAGNDDMDGGDGRDELVGNQGNDRANGGAGNDICNAESEISCDESDTTPPVLTVPEDRTVEANRPEGAVVGFEVSAEDDVDGQLAARCTPESGSTFPIGTTTVTCTATDSAGNTATETFTVTVQDTTSPTITVPEDITVQATSGSDVAVVTFEVTAEDDVDGAATLDEENTLTQDDDVGGDITITCSPRSGSTFSSGVEDHLVRCTATDEAGNTATAFFRINTQL